MGKPYDLQFFLAPYRGSVGTMVCASCKNQIDADEHDFRAGVKSDREEGWRYVVHHRECLSDQSGFVAEETRRADDEAKRQQLLAAAIAFRKDWGVHDLDQLIGELS